MRTIVKNVVQGALAPMGLRLVKWPKGSLTPDASRLADGSIPRHFPVGAHRPWIIPPDLRNRTEIWARTLVGVYEQNASWPASIVPEGGLLLHALVRNIQPRRIVETGTCLGMSTIWMASALQMLGDPSARLYTYDDYRDPPDSRLAASKLFQNRLEGVRGRIVEAGLGSLVEVRVGDCTKLVAEDHGIHSKAGGVQLAFIDADHSPQGAAADFRAVEPILAVGGYVVLHDVYPEIANHLGPRFVIDNLSTIARGKYEVCDLYLAQTNYGMTILRRTA